MRILVYPHAMEIGGSQLNAVEIAAATRDRGHDVVVVSRDGPLVDTVCRLGLRHILLDPRAERRPSRHAASQLTRLAKQHGFDIVHGYEWPPAVEAFAGPRLRLGLPVVCTINSMVVAPFLPRTVPLVVYMDDNRLRAIRAGYSHVTLLEPPVDLQANRPGYDAGTFRCELGFDASVPLLVVVGRLAPEQKLEGLLAACDVVAELAATGRRIQLAIVGDGPSRPLVERTAAAANARTGRRAVVLTGELNDPRRAYAAADIVLGMGGSALRGLAFAKPVVVQGERGFWELLTPDSAPQIMRQGWYGLGAEGDGRAAGATRLMNILGGLLDEPQTRARLGQYGRALVAERFSLEKAATTQEQVYVAAVQASARPAAMPLLTDAFRTGIGVSKHKVVRKWQRWRGTAPLADFNAVATRSGPCAT